MGPDDFAQAGVLDKVKLRKEFDELKLSYEKEARSYHPASTPAASTAAPSSGASA